MDVDCLDIVRSRSDGTPYAKRARQMRRALPCARRRGGLERGNVLRIQRLDHDQQTPSAAHPPASRECTRPRPAGVNGIFQFLFLRVRGRTRVRPREQPANHQLTYPPASRGREWNFPIPLPPRAGTHAGTAQRTAGGQSSTFTVGPSPEYESRPPKPA